MDDIDTFDEELVPEQQASILLALFGMGFVFWCVLSCLLPHDRYIRYQQPQLLESYLFHTRWVYERIHYDKTPIDVAIVGNSRVEGTISAPALEAELSQEFCRPIHVANIAIPNKGRNLNYLLTRELLENHPETKILLVSVIEQQADTTHPGFRYLADAGDLLRAPLLINHYYFSDVAFLPFRQMSYFLQTLIPSWFGMSRSFRSDYLGTALDTTSSFNLPDGTFVDRYHVAPRWKLADESRQMIADYGGQGHSWSYWNTLNNPLETEYTRRLVSIARQHHVEVIFLYIPFYNSMPNMYEKAFYSGLGPVLDAQQYNNNPDDYADAEHFNHYGAEIISKWLKSSIKPYLRPLGNSESCPSRMRAR